MSDRVRPASSSDQTPSIHRHVQTAVADMAAAIERAAADLALVEEPSRFVAALDQQFTDD